MKINLITHLYNEEYLLPWWLKHHRKIFDNIIVIDYNSTDKSLEIVRELIPKAKIIQSKNKYFDAVLCDQEVMDMESSLDGVKLCLTTTEFLVSTRQSIIKKFEDTSQKFCYAIPRIIMIDEEPENFVAHDESLLDRKNFGYDSSQLGSRLLGLHPYRYIHNHINGMYHPGRHSLSIPVNLQCFRIFLYKYSPWSREFINRKLQIKTKIPEHDKRMGYGIQHQMSVEDMENEMKSVLPICKKYDYKSLLKGNENE